MNLKPDILSKINLDISDLKKENLFRQLHETSRTGGIHIIRDGRKLLSFSCNDYLGLSQNPKVKTAAIVAIEKYGTGSGASRFVTGNCPLYKELEQKLAQIKKTEAATVFGSGYLVNLGAIPAFMGVGDLIIADKLVHACLLDGAKLSGAKLMRFSHNSVEKCEELLQKYRDIYKNCIILTDHVFSMDGDVAPVNELYDLAEKYNAWLMTDDAHGFGILPNAKAHIQMGTLSKSAGCYGGYICASAEIVEYLQNKSRSLIYSTALPPSVLASAIEALGIIEQQKDKACKARTNARYFTELLGLPVAQSAIVPMIFGDEQKTITASKILEDEGYLVSAIRPPTVPKNTARLRFTFSSLHTKQNIDDIVSVIKQKLF
ncbi:MAG: 8-amino-7-oxononanoate synthase [Alphaproteobacteria bacterium CG11_big_fil_rev_8_21_14_0_20_39_49]|nr:MAG: 8-amino-7-oxononanoate synthase [Alphaproteobacteria bacterium CG11_big_fil_rev_8_21_14_0_20_39_49]